MTSNWKLSVRDLVLIALLGALLLAVQVALAVIPNVELVSLLVIVYTLVFRAKVIPMIYIFAVLEGLIYGFGIWWIMYLYVWTLLAGVTYLFRKMETTVGWAILSAAFGLLFGLLCSIPYLFVGGFSMMLAWWASGLLFDVLHCVGNFVVCLLLYKPLLRVLQKLNRVGLQSNS